MIFWIAISTLVVLFLSWICFRPTRALVAHRFKGKYEYGRHFWAQTDADFPARCNACRKDIGGWCQLTGLQCLVCHTWTHYFCIKNQQKCKAIAGEGFADSISHHWVESFLPDSARCTSCDMLCGSEFDRNGMVCIWCQRSVHLKCRNYVEKECDFGRYSKSILPPACVKFPPLAVSALPSHVSPILVFINPKSGGQTGLMALMAFNSLLNPVQVINCLDNPREHLKNLSSLKRVRILVAGGDGSVSWMLKLLYDDDIWPGEKPPVGIFPMGTGNDLSNVLNWGVGLRSQASENLWSLTEYAGRMIKDLYLSHVTLLDRWDVSIESGSLRSEIMCNYCGIGLDAKIAYDFHNLREKKPHLFTSRVTSIQYGNKFIYTQLGGYELFSRVCRNFSNRITLKCNGDRVKLPYLEGITILNIPSFAGGVDMWGEDDEELLEESSASDSGISPSHSATIKKRVSKSDGVLEIVGVSSVLHLGECQIGLSKAHRIAQAYEVDIQIRGKDSIPIQIDGEPMLIKGPASIKIRHRDTVTMLSRTVEKHHKVASKVMEVLSWAESKRIIDSSQKSILLTEFAKRCKI